MCHAFYSTKNIAAPSSRRQAIFRLLYNIQEIFIGLLHAGGCANAAVQPVRVQNGYKACSPASV